MYPKKCAERVSYDKVDQSASGRLAKRVYPFEDPPCLADICTYLADQMMGGQFAEINFNCIVDIISRNAEPLYRLCQDKVYL